MKSFKKQNEEAKPVTRVRLPKGKEVIGIIKQRVGGARMQIKCTDGKTRNGKVPGALRRRLWLREGDTILIEPWELDDEKCKVIWKYTPPQVQWLKRNGHLKIEEEEEF